MIDKYKCPFCESDDLGILNTFGMSYQVGCLNCGMIGPQGNSEEMAIKYWNSLCNKMCTHCISRPYGIAIKKRIKAMCDKMKEE